MHRSGTNFAPQLLNWGPLEQSGELDLTGCTSVPEVPSVVRTCREVSWCHGGDLKFWRVFT